MLGKISRKTVLPIVLIALSGSHAAAQEFSVPVTDDFVDNEIRVNAAVPTPYYFRWSLFARNGKLVLCGSGFYAQGELRSTAERMMSNARIEMAGKSYEVDASFFTRVPSRRALDSSEATCKVLPIGIPKNPGTVSFGPGRGRYNG